MAERVGPGDVVGILLPAGAQLLVSIFGTVRAAAAATILPVTAGDAGSQARKLRRLVDALGLRFLIAGDGVHGRIAAELGTLCPALTILATSVDRPTGALPPVAPDDIAVIQLTSGSTMAPRGAQLTHRNLLSGLASLTTTSDMTAADVLVHWAPPHHDMGLIGMLVNVLNGARTHTIPSYAFVRRPETLLTLLAETRGSGNLPGDGATAILLDTNPRRYALAAIASAGRPEAKLQLFADYAPVKPVGPQPPGRSLHSEAIPVMRECIRAVVGDVLDHAGLAPADPRIRVTLFSRLGRTLLRRVFLPGLPAGLPDALSLTAETGHLGAGDMIANISHVIDNQLLDPGQYALGVSIGMGFTATAALVRSGPPEADYRLVGPSA